MKKTTALILAIILAGKFLVDSLAGFYQEFNPEAESRLVDIALSLWPYDALLGFLVCVVLAAIIPNITAVSSTQRTAIIGAPAGSSESDQANRLTEDTTNPLYGVHGWLKFFVVVNMYIAPVLFGIQQIMAFIGYTMLIEDYPGIVVVGLIEAGVGLFLVVKWIMIARRLRDIVPGVVQEAKKWLLISLVCKVLSTPLAFMSGMDAEDLMPGVIKGLFTGVIAFAIWYSYFNVSKRVKATYPDRSQ